MSELVLDRSAGADLLPAYLGQTSKGERTSGGDMERLAQLMSRIVPRSVSAIELEEPPALETSGALARFSKLVDDLKHLLKAPENDEFGPLRPSRSSFSTAISILFPFVQRGFEIPEALDVGTDHDGAIRLLWENGPRTLELVIPYERDAAAYFYHSDGDHYNLQQDLTVTALRRRFNWLQGAQ